MIQIYALPFIFLFLTTSLSLTAAISPAELAQEVDDRCAIDSLNTEEAVQRTKWAHKCQYIGKRTKDNFLLDDDDKPLARPKYPIWVNKEMTKSWGQAPKNENAPCGIPPDFPRKIVCVSSCYLPNQRLSFQASPSSTPDWLAIERAYTEQTPYVMTLTEEANLDRLEFQYTPVHKYTREVIEAWNDMVTLSTTSGGSLTVTLNHPLLDGQGYMREAREFRVGDQLLHYKTGPDRIVSRKEFKYFGQVYNLDTRRIGFKEKLVVAEGFLSGTSYYQNRGHKYMNRQFLRESLPKSVLPSSESN